MGKTTTARPPKASVVSKASGNASAGTSHAYRNSGVLVMVTRPQGHRQCPCASRPCSWMDSGWHEQRGTQQGLVAAATIQEALRILRTRRNVPRPAQAGSHWRRLLLCNRATWRTHLRKRQTATQAM